MTQRALAKLRAFDPDLASQYERRRSQRRRRPRAQSRRRKGLSRVADRRHDRRTTPCAAGFPQRGDVVRGFARDYNGRSMVAAATPQAKRVLVVEDNEDCLATMLDILSIDGCEVRGARNGNDALAFAQRWQPDVILMDLGLPAMDGCEVATRIRSMPCKPRPLIAAVTGWESHEVRARARSCGIDLFMVKPVSWEQLAAIVRRATSASGGTG